MSPMIDVIPVHELYRFLGLIDDTFHVWVLFLMFQVVISRQGYRTCVRNDNGAVGMEGKGRVGSEGRWHMPGKENLGCRS